MPDYKIMLGDCIESLKTLPEQSVNCCVTSPPYFGLRDYGVDGQIGLEQTPEQYIAKMVDVFREVRRVLADNGTLRVNIGDSYAGAGYSNHKGTGGTRREAGGKQCHLSGTGCKNKDLIGIPWMLAFALRADGWYLRQDIIWHKPNPMPESVRDRCTKAHEYVFLLSKSERYFFDSDAIKEPADPATRRYGMSEQVGRFALGDGSGALVVYADDYDALAQRCRDWELNHAMLRDELEIERQSVAAFRKERDALRSEIETLREIREIASQCAANGGYLCSRDLIELRELLEKTK